MAERSKKRLLPTDYTVAIVCPLEVETSAMRYMLDEEHLNLPRIHGDLNSYIFGEVSGHNVVIGFLPHGSQGVGAAATVATDMRRTFPWIKLRLLIGLAGGIPSRTNDVRLGDVVVSMPSGVSGGVLQYDLGKETITGFERKGWLEAPPKEWRDAAVLMMSDHRVRGNQVASHIAELLVRYPQLKQHLRPDTASDVLYEPSSVHKEGEITCSQCDETQLIVRDIRNPTGPVIFFGLIASGNRVVKNGQVRDNIGQEAGGALCLEMEAAGLMNDFHCIVIRGICDYADSHKNDKWHAYAAATAAACAKELLTYAEPPTEYTPSSSLEKYFIVPKQHVKDFIGREEELARLESYFSTSTTGRPRIATVHALGGQGKTQLVLEYCHRSRPTYQGTFWINASSVSAANQSMIGIAGRLDISGSMSAGNAEAKTEFVLRTLAHWDGRWLMVFDNCDDPETFQAIRELFPDDGRGNILLTSRHRSLESLGMLLELPPMPPAVGAALLLSGYPGIDLQKYLEVGSRIVNRLGGLALAIKQAAAYIQHQALSLECLEDFLVLYEARRKDVLRYTPEVLWEYGALRADSASQKKAINAFTTWGMSLQYLCYQQPGQHKSTLHVLTLAAFLASIPLSEAIFQMHLECIRTPPEWMGMFLMDAPDESDDDGDTPSNLFNAKSVMPSYSTQNPTWSHDKFWNFIRLAEKNSLVQAISSGTYFGSSGFLLHPLIRDCLQLRAKRTKLCDILTEAINVIVDCVHRTKQLEHNVSVNQSLLLHIDAILQADDEHTKVGQRLGEKLEDSHAVDTVADHCLSVGRYNTAKKLYDRQFQAHLMTYGLSHSRTLVCGKNLVTALKGCGEYDIALSVMRQILQARQTDSDSNNLDNLKIMLDLSNLLKHQGFYQSNKYEEAESILKEVLETDHTILSPSNPLRILAMNDMAFLLRTQARYEEAEETFRKVVDLYRHSLGGQRQRTLVAIHNLAKVLLHRNEPKEAETLLREISVLQSKSLGENHPRYLMIMVSLSTCRRLQGDPKAAEQILREVVEKLTNALHKDHAGTVCAIYRLALALQDQGRTDEALQTATKVVTVTCKMYESESAAAKRYGSTVMDMLRQQGESDEAISQTLRELAKHGSSSDVVLDGFVNNVVQGKAAPWV